MTAELDSLGPYLADRIPLLMAEHGVPSLAIAVVHGPDSWLAGFGRTRRTSGSPVEETTAFSLQSISKIFTTLAALAAVRDGLVDLDDPVSQHLPEFTVQSRFEDRPQDTMTLRQLLCHAADFTHEAPVGSNFAGRGHCGGGVHHRPAAGSAAPGWQASAGQAGWVSQRETR